jgi:thiol:disulfide interchange protein DsbD
MRALALLLSLLPTLAFGATSNVAVTPRDTAALISQTDTAENGAIQLALQFHLAPGWHIYWQNAGDAGFPPAIALTGALAGPFTYPAPQLLIQGPVAAYVLSGDIRLPFTATHVSGATIQADAQWLICSDICVPEHAHFTLPLTGAPGHPNSDQPVTPPNIVSRSPYPATIAPDGTLSLSLAAPSESAIHAADIATAHFFPLANGAIINRDPQLFMRTPTGIALKLPTTPNFTTKTPLQGVLELTDKAGTIQSLAITPRPINIVMPAHTGINAFLVAPTSLAATLALAFLGGLILNLMPCVFPILAMKALAIARLGGQAAPKIRAESFAYTAGILAAMLILATCLLALRAAGIQAGWGFQFQSPIFVAIIAWLIFAAGLSLAGVLKITGLSNVGARLAGRHSFFTGLLAVTVATPCTAPFMGAAVAAALTAKPVAALAIFLTLGLGLSLPFLLLGCIPGFARLLPRPGRWMLQLQRALALPMFATALWLAWVLKFQAGLQGLLLLAIGAAGLYAAATQPRLRPAALAALLVIPFFHHPATGAALTLPGAEPYSAPRLASLQSAHQPVLIDMTAAWCVTCLVNDRTTLSAPAVQSALAARHVALLVGDWTNRNPAITAFLAAHHRDGVPLYVYVSPTGTAQTLPQLLTPNIIERAIN